MATKTVRKTKVRVNIAQFAGQGGFGSAAGEPFYRFRLPRASAAALLGDLRECCAAQDRSWFTLTATSDQTSRLRLTRNLRTPAYEALAAQSYLRGEIFRVNGTQGKSCNIDFSAQVGAGLLADRLASACEQMRGFIEIRIRSRNRNVVEFIPDRELEAQESAEHDALARTGEALAAQVWPRDDFSDWDV